MINQQSNGRYLVCKKYDILAGAYSEGEHFFVESLPYNRMTSIKPKRQQFASVCVIEAKPSEAKILKLLRVIESLAPNDAEVNRKVTFSVGPSLKRGIDFLVNNDLHTHDGPVKVGNLQIWELSNTSLMDHPFHLHGFFFQVIEENGKEPKYQAWKDTINLPPKSITVTCAEASAAFLLNVNQDAISIPKYSSELEFVQAFQQAAELSAENGSPVYVYF